MEVFHCRRQIEDVIQILHSSFSIFPKLARKISQINEAYCDDVSLKLHIIIVLKIITFFYHSLAYLMFMTYTTCTTYAMKLEKIVRKRKIVRMHWYLECQRIVCARVCACAGVYSNLLEFRCIYIECRALNIGILLQLEDCRNPIKKFAKIL